MKYYFNAWTRQHYNMSNIINRTPAQIVHPKNNAQIIIIR